MRIGVSGHRFLADLDKLNAGVNQALDLIEGAFTGKDLTVLSSLAEGADRLVARHVLDRPGGRLVVPLPLAEEDYIEDFTDPASRREFAGLLARAASVVTLPDAPTRDAAYQAAGEYIAQHCDVLLALWDGQCAQGQGGTAGVVAQVRGQGKPIVIVRAGNRRPGTQEPTSLGPEQGRVIAERMPERGA